MSGFQFDEYMNLSSWFEDDLEQGNKLKLDNFQYLKSRDTQIYI